MSFYQTPLFYLPFAAGVVSILLISGAYIHWELGGVMLHKIPGKQKRILAAPCLLSLLLWSGSTVLWPYVAAAAGYSANSPSLILVWPLSLLTGALGLMLYSLVNGTIRGLFRRYYRRLPVSGGVGADFGMTWAIASGGVAGGDSGCGYSDSGCS